MSESSVVKNALEERRSLRELRREALAARARDLRAEGLTFPQIAERFPTGWTDLGV